MALYTIEDILHDGYNRLRPGTLQHADQLVEYFLTESREIHLPDYVAADGAAYFLKEGVPTLGLTRHTLEEPHNLVLSHLNDLLRSSCDQLRLLGNFYPDSEEARKALEAKSTLCIDLTKLRVMSNGDSGPPIRCIPIYTEHLDWLLPEERKLAEWLCGKEDRFVAAMGILSNLYYISKVDMSIFHPSYVKEQGGPIARFISCSEPLGSFNINLTCSQADACYAFRGECKEERESVPQPVLVRGR